MGVFHFGFTFLLSITKNPVVAASDIKMTKNDIPTKSSDALGFS